MINLENPKLELAKISKSKNRKIIAALAIILWLWWAWWWKLNNSYQEYLNSKEEKVKVYNNISDIFLKDEIVWQRWISVSTTKKFDWKWLLSEIAKYSPKYIDTYINGLDDKKDTIILNGIMQFGLKNIADTTNISYDYSNPNIDKLYITMPDPAIFNSVIDFTKSTINGEENIFLWNSVEIKNAEADFQKSWWNNLRNEEINKIFNENKEKILELCIQHIIHKSKIFAANTKHENPLLVIIRNSEWKIIAKNIYESNHKQTPKDNFWEYLKKSLHMDN